MRHPLTVEMGGRSVVCVGGGAVAASKVVPLARSGAVVTVISPDCVEELAAVASSWTVRRYVPGDLAGSPPVMLAVAATGDPEVDQSVADEATERGIWCLRVDGRGSAAMPAVIRRGELLIALMTGAPALTRRLRMQLDELLDDRWTHAATVLAGLRTDPAVRQALADLPAADRRARWRAATDAALASDDSGLASDVLLGRGLGGVRDSRQDA